MLSAEWLCLSVHHPSDITIVIGWWIMVVGGGLLESTYRGVIPHASKDLATIVFRFWWPRLPQLGATGFVCGY